NKVLDGRAPSLHGLLWRARISLAAGDHLSFVSLVSFVSHVAYKHGQRERGRPSRPSHTHQSKTWAPDSVGARAVERMWGGPLGSPASCFLAHRLEEHDHIPIRGRPLRPSPPLLTTAAPKGRPSLPRRERGT